MRRYLVARSRSHLHARSRPWRRRAQRRLLRSLPSMDSIPARSCSARNPAMTPDQLLAAWSDIIRDVVGPKGQWRKEALTFDEWRKLDDAWLSMKQINVRGLARDM